MFVISKRAAVTVTIFCAGMAMVLFIAQAAACAWPFLMGAVVYGCIAYFKQARDVKIVHESRQVQQQNTTADQLPPPMSSPGSHRLFVPPPLQHRP